MGDKYMVESKISGLETVISTVPFLPLKNSVLFPYLVIPLSVGRKASLAAVEAALNREDKTLAVFSQKDSAIEEPTLKDLYDIGTLAVIKKVGRSEDNLQIVVQGTQRIELLALTRDQNYYEAHARLLREPEDSGTEIEALRRAVMDLATKLLELVQPEVKLGLSHVISEVENPLYQAYLLGSILSLDMEKEQAILAAKTRREALQLAHDYLSHEVQVLELRNKIATQARSEMSKEQREYLLRQQLRAIQGELGEKSPEQMEVIELRKRMEELNLPELVQKEVDKELTRLDRMSANSPDYQIARTYIELVLELPWNTYTDDNLDLKYAREVLDADHFNLNEVKDRIIEHLAVMKLNPNAKSPILCFLGPPGVGKTSLGQSIARALGRKFERIALGGLHDEAELRGHRRTYIGAMPGRILRSIRRSAVKNPLIMLDEIDKMGRDYRGDPAAAMMEILDPAQNESFLDNYLDLPFDLSKVFFVTTANSLDTIPRPLLDRMEILRLSGYSSAEKLEIANRYLIDRQITDVGLTSDQIEFSDEAVEHIIKKYTREAGVRELNRVLGRVTRKIATRVAQGDLNPVVIKPDLLEELLGPERFFVEEARKSAIPGVAAGLAWTETGGDVLYIEAVLLPEGKDLTLTGQLGSVMQESARAAQSYLWSKAEKMGIAEDSLRKNGIHIHVPAGAIPKDGPSAGVTMVTALTSLLTGKAVRNDTAMTGEITLSGLVFPVGGIKEKVLAAHRAGIRRIILPKDNAKDLKELPENINHEMEFILATRIEDVLNAAIVALVAESA